MSAAFPLPYSPSVRYPCRIIAGVGEMTDPSAGSGDSQNSAQVFAYEHVQDTNFESVLAQRPWESMYGGLALRAPCPVCGDPDAIDVFVPVVTALFRDATPTPPELIECQCAGKHNAPPGGMGCGRYGMIRPRMAGPGKGAGDAQ